MPAARQGEPPYWQPNVPRICKQFGATGGGDRLLPLEELELQVPVLLLLEVASLPLRLPPNLALLRRHVLTLTLDRARQTALLSGGRTRQERHRR